MKTDFSLNLDYAIGHRCNRFAIANTRIKTDFSRIWKLLQKQHIVKSVKISVLEVANLFKSVSKFCCIIWVKTAKTYTTIRLRKAIKRLNGSTIKQ